MRLRCCAVFVYSALTLFACVGACANDATGSAPPPSRSLEAGADDVDPSTPTGGGGHRDAESALPSSDAGPACPALTTGCAPYDPGSGRVHACAVLGRSGNETLCQLEIDDCRPACAEAARHGRVDSGPIVSVPDANPGQKPPPQEAGVPESGTPPRGHDAGHKDAGTNVCEDIGAACAKIDPGTGPVHDCAVLRDSTDIDACDAALSGCSSLCGASLCVRLGSICHDVDPGSGPLHDCHFGGHAGVADWCFENAVHCYAICEAAAEGT